MQNSQPTALRGYRETINAPTAAPIKAPIETSGNAALTSTSVDSIG